MTSTNSTTKTKTEQIQEYLERDLPRSVIIDAFRTGKHEPIVKHVKEHYGRSTISYRATADFIGIEVNVRDAIQNIALKTSPYKELARLPSFAELVDRYGQDAAVAINDERNGWLKLIENLKAPEQDQDELKAKTVGISGLSHTTREVKDALTDTRFNVYVRDAEGNQFRIINARRKGDVFQVKSLNSGVWTALDKSDVIYQA